ncbi:hypothetical protein [Paraburkholderia graminis]
MIVFNDEILFVHNPKTAGTSLIQYLASTLPGEVRVAGVQEIGTYHPHLSRSVDYAQKIVGNRGFKKILAVIRNPFDREVSMYTYFRDVLYASPSLKTDLPDMAMQRRVAKCAELDFKSYLKWLWREEGTIDVWRSELFYKRADGSSIDALRILKFESLEADLAKALDLQTVQLPKTNSSNRGPTADYYNEETTEIVRTSYEWVFNQGFYV